MLTVVTPPTNRKLTTVERVKLIAGTTVSSLTDPAITLLIEQASSAIARFCSREFGRAVLKEEFPYQQRRVGLPLSWGPVESIEGVTMGGNAVLPADYAIDSGGYLFRVPNTLVWGPAVVDYTAGYVMPGDSPAAGQTKLPDEIERAAILMVASYGSVSKRDPNLRSETIDDVNTLTWATGGNTMGGSYLPSAEAEALLERYRLPTIA